MNDQEAGKMHTSALSPPEAMSVMPDTAWIWLKLRAVRKLDASQVSEVHFSWGHGARVRTIQRYTETTPHWEFGVDGDIKLWSMLAKAAFSALNTFCKENASLLIPSSD